jgi:hypothetical protein
VSDLIGLSLDTASLIIVLAKVPHGLADEKIRDLVKRMGQPREKTY